MLIKRNTLESLYKVIDIKLNNLTFSIQTQYKFLKLKKVLQEELQLYYTQLAALTAFFELDDDGNPIVSEDGGVKIKEDSYDECNRISDEINAVQIQVPDLYFSLDELQGLGLTLQELEVLEPFIKE